MLRSSPSLIRANVSLPDTMSKLESRRRSFAETKEALGGYYIVDCDEAEAVKIAGRIPADSRSWVQVRPIGLFRPNVARISQRNA